MLELGIDYCIKIDVVIKSTCLTGLMTKILMCLCNFTRCHIAFLLLKIIIPANVGWWSI